MKQCRKCGISKPLTEFPKHPGCKNGLNSRCKKCLSGYAKKYRQTHKIEYAKYLRKYRQTLKGCLRDRFQNMKRRCIDSNFREYKHYGGRGIKCLFKSSREFVDYVVNELQADPRGLQIDRINNDGNYEKGNIRFVTHSENCKNRRKRKCVN